MRNSLSSPSNVRRAEEYAYFFWWFFETTTYTERECHAYAFAETMKYFQERARVIEDCLNYADTAHYSCVLGESVTGVTGVAA